MNFSQIHEKLRHELLRRIQRGTLSVSLLARQTGFGQPHLSNFLRGQRQLSLAGMDRILAAQRLTVADLLPVLAVPLIEEQEAVPLVTHAAEADAEGMGPVVQPDAIALVDRHYNSFTPYRAHRPNLYAVRQGADLRLRYASLMQNRLVMRPQNLGFPVELIDAGELESPADLLAGRVALLLNKV
jgi:transcriptional regulator with XRE-family HTH domain